MLGKLDGLDIACCVTPTETFFGKMQVSRGACFYNIQNANNTDKFNHALIDLLNNLSNQAAVAGSLGKYATNNSTMGFFQTVLGLSPCNSTLPLFGLRLITFRMQISLVRVDLELFTR